jgi:pimeloyl-ACP methyl ester carboxylesterase
MTRLDDSLRQLMRAQGSPSYVLGYIPHRDVQHAIRLTGREHREDVRIIHRCCRPGLADEPLPKRLVGRQLRLLMRETKAQPWYGLTYLGDPGLATDQALEDAAAFEWDSDITLTLRQLRIPVLLFYGATDRWVPVEPSIAAWRAALSQGRAPLRVSRLPGCGHFPTLAADPADLDEAGRYHRSTSSPWQTGSAGCRSPGNLTCDDDLFTASPLFQLHPPADLPHRT